MILHYCAIENIQARWHSYAAVYHLPDLTSSDDSQIANGPASEGARGYVLVGSPRL